MARAISPGIAGQGGPQNIAAPSVAWTVLIGNSPTITSGTWTGAPTLTYTLYRDNVAVGGATGLTLAAANAYVAVFAGDIGSQLKWAEIPNGNTLGQVFTNTVSYAGIVSHFAPSSFVDERSQTVAGGVITVWGDQSGNARNWNMALVDPTKAPTQVTDDAELAARFRTSVPQWTQNTDSPANVRGTTGCCMLFVIDDTGITRQATHTNPYDEPGIFSDSFGTCGVSITTSGYRGFGYNGTYHTTTYDPTGPGLTLVEWTYDGTNIGLRVGSNAKLTAALVSPVDGGGTNIWLARNYNNAVHIDATILSVIAKATSPSAAQLINARAFASYKYGLGLSS